MTGDPLDRLERRIEAQLPRHRELNSPRYDVLMECKALVAVARAAKATASVYPYEGRWCAAALARLDKEQP